jgi:hypothetical protein
LELKINRIRYIKRNIFPSQKLARLGTGGRKKAASMGGLGLLAELISHDL